ncbi:MAG: FKBP-type peptidyl-prolyl cis-trans isomerase [Daejeonella sp.]
MAKDLKSRGITGLNYSLVSQAMNDGFTAKTGSLTPEQCQKIVYNHLSSLNKKKYEGGIAEGNKFLEDNKGKEGIITLPSGLQYQVLTPATGDKPKATDEVTVHYKGTLMNGKQFDSSYDRNEPATFPLNGVIPGWTEGVQLMPVGSKYKFFIPYQLGYGANGAGQDIPPYSVLIFEIELIKIGK